MKGPICRNCLTIWRHRPRADGCISSVGAQPLDFRVGNSSHHLSHGTLNRRFATRRWSSTVSSDSSVSSIYDPDKRNWEEWFLPKEYANPWDNENPTLVTLDYLPLDRASRHTIQLLQDLYHGITGFDRPTTEGCNRCIQLVGNPQLGGNKLEGRAQRADAILQHMELFYGRFKEKRLAFPLPHPNHDTYFAVLRLYAQTKILTAEQGPKRCHEILKRMQQRYVELGQFDVKPNTIHWNQVLSAWANCLDVEKAFHAARLLQDLQAEGLADASSFGHVLRACAVSDQNVRAQNLGHAVALRVWKDAQKSEIEATSYMYTFVLQACLHMDNVKQRDEMVEAVFLMCCNHGKLNAHVVQAFQQAASPRLYKNLLGVLFRQDKEDPASIVHRVPTEWTRNADSKSASGW